MILSTSRLFTGLLRPLRIDVVCDIGSLNGADALRFRRALPTADIIAFEANPQNYQAMLSTPALAQSGIEVLHCAAAEREGSAEFYVVPVGDAGNLARRGMSSLYQRDVADQRGTPVPVTTRRVDNVLIERAHAARNIALWIDAEGAAFEVLEGTRGVLGKVRLVHVEVETMPCIGAAQKLYPAVAAFLESQGFEQVATDSPIGLLQFNALYVRTGLPRAMRAALWRHTWYQQLRRWVVRGLLAPLPARIRHSIRTRLLTPAAVPRTP